MYAKVEYMKFIRNKYYIYHRREGAAIYFYCIRKNQYSINDLMYSRRLNLLNLSVTIYYMYRYNVSVMQFVYIDSLVQITKKNSLKILSKGLFCQPLVPISFCF